jgi:glycosyltransferase involved in cell wall biosynthesis
VRRSVTILTGIFPPDTGGPATSVPELASWLARNGWDPTIVTLADSLPEQQPEDGVERVPRTLSWPRRTRAVVRAVRKSRPAVVFANGLHLESTFLTGVPVVQKIVGDWAWERARNRGWTAVDVDDFQRAAVPLRAWAVRVLRAAVTRRADSVVVPSRHLAFLVRNWGVADERITVVPNAAPELEPSLERDPRRVVFVGRLVPWKHVDHVIRVLSRLPDVTFEVVGVGPRLEALRELVAALGLEQRVVFHGALPREEALAVMRNAGALILPSSYEGMPHVVLEAFALGVPVVGSDAPGISALVEDDVSGVLYPVGELSALEQAVRRALTPEVAARLASGGHEYALRATLDASARATSAALEKALTRAGHA